MNDLLPIISEIITDTTIMGVFRLKTFQSIPYATSDVPAADRYQIHLTVTGTSCDKYPAKQHARKVAAQLGVSHGLIYLVGQPTILLDDSDQAIPFRQRRYFYYITGVEEPDCFATYDIKNDLLTLYVPDFNLRQAIWMGPTLTVEEALERYDIDRARYHACLSGDIANWAGKYNSDAPIYVLHDSQRPESTSQTIWLDSTQLQPAMNASRGVKDQHEIELIRRANVISGLAHTNILKNIGKMTNEAEIEGLFLDTCISHGAKSQAYGIIAASGENAATLHYMKNNEPFGERQLVCLDAGAEYECYASDVTRSFPLNSKGEWPSAEARDIYHAVERMQEECIRRIRKGVRFLDLHVLANVIAIEELLELGIFKGGTVDEIRESGAASVFFPHGLGHHVGLEVHDVSGKSIMASEDGDVGVYYRSVLIPDNSRPPCTLSAPTLEEGMVVTVEPGIYFSRLAIANAKKLPVAKFIDFDVAERYIPIGGVRIEDDILVTADGYENLTTAPKGDKALEIIRKGK